MILHLQQKVSGRYKFKVLKSDRTVKYETGWCDNLITDNGLELIGTASATWAYCSVGSGTTTPAFTDTQLATHIATTNTIASGGTSQGIVGSPDYYAFDIKTFEFATGTAAGNLSEVGVGTASDGTSLQSRALIVDGNGDPTTITVLSDEILQVTFERRHHIPQTDVTGTVDISGNSHNYTLRAADALNNTSWSASLVTSAYNAGTNVTVVARAYDGTIGATIEDSPSGTAASRDSFVTAAYTADSHQRDGTIKWDLADANFGTGIKSIRFTADMRSTYQAEFDPVINKNDTQVLEINVRHSWSRV